MISIIIEYNLLSHTWNYFICYFVFYLTIPILPVLIWYMTLIFMFFDHPIPIHLWILAIMLGRWIAWWLSSSQYKFIMISKGPSCKTWWSDWKITCLLTSYIQFDSCHCWWWIGNYCLGNDRLMAAKLLPYLVGVINPGLSIFHASEKDLEHKWWSLDV